MKTALIIACLAITLVVIALLSAALYLEKKGKKAKSTTPDPDPANDTPEEESSEGAQEQPEPKPEPAPCNNCPEEGSKADAAAAKAEAEDAKETATLTSEKLELLIEALKLNTLPLEKKHSAIISKTKQVEEDELKLGKAVAALEASRSALAEELEGTSDKEFLNARNVLTRTGNNTAGSNYGETYKVVTSDIIFGDEDAVMKAGEQIKASHAKIEAANMEYQKVLVDQDAEKNAADALAERKAAHKKAQETASDKASSFEAPIAAAEEETAAANKHAAIFENL